MSIDIAFLVDTAFINKSVTVILFHLYFNFSYSFECLLIFGVETCIYSNEKLFSKTC